MVEAVVGLVVGLRGWCSLVTGVGSDCHLRCSRPVRRSRISHCSICSGRSGHCCSGMQNVVKRGKNKMSLSSSYQAGGACRHVKQRTVVLTQAAKSASENSCSSCYLHTKGVVLHVATYIQNMFKVVVVVVKLLRWSFVVLNAYPNALDEPV